MRFRGKAMDGDGNAGLLIKDGPYGGFVFIQGNIGGWNTIHTLTTDMQAAAKATGSPLAALHHHRSRGRNLAHHRRRAAGAIRSHIGRDLNARAGGRTRGPDRSRVSRAGFQHEPGAGGRRRAQEQLHGQTQLRQRPRAGVGLRRGGGDGDIRQWRYRGGQALPGSRQRRRQHSRRRGACRRLNATFETVHLAPFRAAIAAGADGIMLSHITATAYDPDNPASRSAELIRLLREDLGFDGLIVTDSLSMAAAANGPIPRGRPWPHCRRAWTSWS